MAKYYIPFHNLNMYLKEFGTYNAIIIAIFITMIYLLFTRIKHGKSSVKINKTLSVLFFSFNIAFILQITLIGRIGRHYDAWSKINCDWNIFDSPNLIENSQARNIALFLFIMPSVFLLLKCFKNKVIPTKSLLISGAITSFSLSLFIELCQGIFSVGTFQFSDLFYNTLGGIIGTLIYIAILKLKNNMHKNKKSSTK